MPIAVLHYIRIKRVECQKMGPIVKPKKAYNTIHGAIYVGDRACHVTHSHPNWPSGFFRFYLYFLTLWATSP